MKNVYGVVFAALIASSMILVPFASAATCPDDEKKPAAKKDGAKPKREPGAMFKKMDKNGDGKVSKDEFVNSRKSDDAKKKAEGFFGKRDKNSDGFITKDELAGPGKGKKDADKKKKKEAAN